MLPSNYAWVGEQEQTDSLSKCLTICGPLSWKEITLWSVESGSTSEKNQMVLLCNNSALCTGVDTFNTKMRMRIIPGVKNQDLQLSL